MDRLHLPALNRRSAAFVLQRCGPFPPGAKRHLKSRRVKVRTLRYGLCDQTKKPHCHEADPALLPVGNPQEAVRYTIRVSVFPVIAPAGLMLEAKVP